MWKVLTKKQLATISNDPHPAPGPDLGKELLPDFRDQGLDVGVAGDLPVGQTKVVGPHHRAGARTENAVKRGVGVVYGPPEQDVKSIAKGDERGRDRLR